MSVCDWLSSLNIVSSRFIHFVSCVRIFLFWLKNIPLWVYTKFYHHSFIDGHLDCFRLLAIVGNSFMNMGTLSCIFLNFLIHIPSWVELFDSVCLCCYSPIERGKTISSWERGGFSSDKGKMKGESISSAPQILEEEGGSLLHYPQKRRKGL